MYTNADITSFSTMLNHKDFRSLKGTTEDGRCRPEVLHECVSYGEFQHKFFEGIRDLASIESMHLSK